MRRREFLAAAGAAATAGPEVAHLLPTVSDRRIQLKSSFTQPLLHAPRLNVAGRTVEGLRTDSAGLFWRFDADSLQPGQPYELTLLDSSRKILAPPWTLKTFPDPSDRVSRFRLLIYTCAGGHDALVNEKGETRFLPLRVRRRLLDRALSFAPDAAVANGDHLYWDLRTRTAAKAGASAPGIAYAGTFDRVQPVFGHPNEKVLLRAAGPQIAGLYGTRFRSVPVFFITDDHDYFENDEADDRFVSLPPDAFMLRLARAVRRLYYPEFLPDANRPAGLPGEGCACGTLRYGSLAELLMYDCRRFMTLNGPSAVFVAPEAEDWLKARMAAPGVAHVVNIPSTPPGWSAGKWGEWYPDVLDEAGRLGVARAKPYWQPGWAAQHDRLLAASSAMKDRVPLFVSGDLHATAEARIIRSGTLNLSAHPVISALSGPIGTGKEGWPSAVRNTPPLKPFRIETEGDQRAAEENGFLLLDFSADRIAARFFKWNVALPEAAIDSLMPYRTLEWPR